MWVCLTPQPLIFPLCHTSSQPLPVLLEQTQFGSNMQAMMTCPCHTSQLNHIISKALCSCLACPGKCLFWDMPLSEQLNVLDGLSHTHGPHRPGGIESLLHLTTETILRALLPIWGLFQGGVKAISRSMGAINRALGFSQLTMFMFFGLHCNGCW